MNTMKRSQNLNKREKGSKEYEFVKESKMINTYPKNSSAHNIAY